MEVRPIDAEATYQAMVKTIAAMMRTKRWMRSDKDNEDEILLVIQNAPTIDYAPVRHGEWVEEGNLIWCSRCLNSPLYDYFGKIKLSSSCPHCGARMEEDEKDEQIARR